MAGGGGTGRGASRTEMVPRNGPSLGLGDHSYSEEETRLSLMRRCFDHQNESFLDTV